MELDINCKISDVSYVKVLFLKQNENNTHFFGDILENIRNEILNISQNFFEDVNEKSIWDNILTNCSEHEINIPSLRFSFEDICFNDINQIFIKNDYSVNAYIIVVLDLMNTINEGEFFEIANKLRTELSITYKISFKINYEDTETIEVKSFETGDCLSCSLKVFAKKILLDTVGRIDSEIKKSIEEISSNHHNKFEMSGKQDLLNISKKKFIAELYLLLGLPISSAMYYNNVIELIEEHNPKLFFDLSYCTQGQASLLFLFYKLYDSPHGWWEVGSNSINSFIQELPVPLQLTIQQTQSNNFSVLDSIVINQSKKFLLFDTIHKKLSVALGLMGKANRVNSPLIFDSNFQEFETDKLIVPMYNIILMKAHFLLENFITSHFERKLVIDFLDPYFNSIEQTSKVIPKNFIRNYSLFLLGCVNVLKLAKCYRKVGIILIQLTRIFLKHKIFGLSFNVSCVAYDWYSNIYSKEKIINTKMIQNLILVIKNYKDSCCKHELCTFCYSGMNPNIIIRDTYFCMTKILNVIKDNMDKYLISNKQYLNNNYMQYLTIYKHDLALKYSVFPSRAGYIFSESDFQLNTQLELLLYLRPFINSFVRYGIHSMLQAYRRYNKDTKKRIITGPYPARYETLVLLHILESAIYHGCSSRSISSLSTLLEKIIYFPPLYDLEVFTTIQSKCIDTLSILSSNLQSPFVKTPLYTLTTSKKRGFTSIESLNISISNIAVHSTHLLLLFNISYETSSITTEPCNKCISRIKYTCILNQIKDNFCTSCGFFTNNISGLSSMLFQTSSTNTHFESQSFGDKYNWIPIQEKNSNYGNSMFYRNSVKFQGSNPFLYDPFEKKSSIKEHCDRKDFQDSQLTSILWEVGKQYTVHVGLFNPFSIPIILDCFSLIIEGDVSCDIYPVSVVVPPTPRFSIPGCEVKVAVNIVPKNSGNFKVIGITYKFSGIVYVNFGAKSLFTGNRGPLMPYMNIFTIPKLESDIFVNYNETNTKWNLGSEIDGKIEIENIKNVPDELKNQFHFENTTIMVEKDSYMLDIVSGLDISYKEYGFLIRMNYLELTKIKRLKFLFKTKFTYKHKTVFLSTIFILTSRNFGFPRIKSSYLIPKLQYSPIKQNFLSSKWEINKIWLILDIEKNSKLCPIEFSFPEKFSKHKITIPKDINCYRWVIETSLDHIYKLNTELEFLNWVVHSPNSSIDATESNVIQQGKISIGRISREFQSNYVFDISIEYNGTRIPNNSVLPTFSAVYVKISAENMKTTCKKINIKLVPIGETSKIKQIYLDYSDYITNSESPWLSFSIIGLEKKTFEWIVGIEEIDLISNETIFHWKSELLSISFT
ncbi:hypothetical protein FG386_001669 [Cryptosporidium ryanae]|uniref:uncharacterized protein n=1 Tax=Cryptosporidium ryanae TaxID=515981 RepID=UPI003519EB25|nr:hypothetical protein FG386_001669 [Cryptosporidium ryanae]